MNRKEDPIKICEHCKKQFFRVKYPSKLQDLTNFKKRKFCCKICMLEHSLEKEQTRQWLGRKVQKYKKEACEKCQSSHELQVHHIDRNWKNNEPENLMTLCASCHAKEHHEAGDFSHIYELASVTKRKKRLQS